MKYLLHPRRPRGREIGFAEHSWRHIELQSRGHGRSGLMNANQRAAAYSVILMDRFCTFFQRFDAMVEQFDAQEREDVRTGETVRVEFSGTRFLFGSTE